MTARNTSDELQSFLGGIDENLTQYIVLASHVVDSHLASVISNSDILKDIELYIAAHYYDSLNPEISEIRYDKSVEKYNVSTDKDSNGFSGTKWGRLALALDYTGVLGNLGRRKVSVIVV